MKKEISGNNGVYFVHKPDESINNSRLNLPFAGEILRSLLCIIAALGALFTVQTMFSLKVETYVPIVVSAITALVFNFAILKLKKPSLLLLLGLAVLVAVVLFAFPSVERGATILYDQGYKSISASMFWDVPKATYAWKNAYYSDTNLVFGMLSFILTLVIAYFTTVRTSFIAIFLLTFPFFEIGAAFGCVPNHFAFAVMLGSWAAMLGFYQANHIKRNTKKRKSVYIGKKGSFAGSAIVIAALTLALFLGGKEFLAVIGMSRIENVDVLRKDVKTKAEEVIDYILGKDNDGSMKEGKLLELDDHKVKDRHYITMETSLPSINENLYLTGYSATKYSKNEWGQTENYEKYKKLFDLLEDSSYRIPGINGALLRNHKEYGTLEQAHITLSDFRRVKDYMYAAGMADPDETYKTIYDYSFTPKNKEKYEYDIFINSLDRKKITKSKLYELVVFKNAMKAYSEFVQEEYTVSASTENVRALAESLYNKDAAKTVDNIRNYLNDNINYTFIVNKSPENLDFVDNFLFNEKKGYCAHYATAAAVLLQNCGVPTRYVEGYCILKEDFNSSKNKNKYGWITFDITDKYAHAWIEVYFDKSGWIPVDVTPGFYEGSFYDYMQQFLIEWEEIPEEESGAEEIEKEENTVFDEDEGEEIPYEYEEPSLAEILEKEKKEALKKIEQARLERLRRLMTIVIAIALVIFAIVAYIVIRYIIIRRRRKLLSPDNPQRSVFENFKYFQKLSKFEKIDTKFALCSEYVKTFKEKSEFVDSDRIDRIFAIILKNAYSENGANVEEATEVWEFVRVYEKQIHKAKRLPSRIKRAMARKKAKRKLLKMGKA